MGTASTNMKDTIILKARELFIEQGYAATSIKQIATAAECATSALYYYFEEGKPQILREVIHSYSPDLFQLFSICKDATSLPEILDRFGQTLLHARPDLLLSINWLLLDFPRLRREEKEQVHAMFLSLHRFLTGEIARFVEHEQIAHSLAWMLVCTYFGYEQLFLTLEIEHVSDLPRDTFIQLATNVLDQSST